MLRQKPSQKASVGRPNFFGTHLIQKTFAKATQALVFCVMLLPNGLMVPSIHPIADRPSLEAQAVTKDKIESIFDRSQREVDPSGQSVPWFRSAPSEIETFNPYWGSNLTSSSIHLPLLQDPSVPPHDDFDQAIIIDSFPHIDSQDISGATLGLDDPFLICSGWKFPQGTVWYAYTASTDQALTVNTFGSNFDTVLGVYTGTRGALVAVGCNDDFDAPQSSVTFSAIAGQTYYVMVLLPVGESGSSLTISLQTAVPPANDDIESATIISELPFRKAQDTTLATVASDDPAMSCGAPFFETQSNTVWFQFKPTVQSGIAITTSGSEYSTVVAVWEVSGGALIELACDEMTNEVGYELVLMAEQGVNYWIEVAQWGFEDGGYLNFIVRDFAPPLNDDIDAAQVLTIPGAVDIDSRLATTAADDPTPSCSPASGSQGSHSLWYSITPADSVNAGLTMPNTYFESGLAVYSGERGSLTELGCKSRPEFRNPLLLDMHAGQTYWLEIFSGVAEEGGQGRLQVREWPQSGCENGTCTFFIEQGSDDAGTWPVSGCPDTADNREIYFGRCAGEDITSGFRFVGVDIPPRATIESAYLTFTTDGYYELPLKLEINAEASGNAATFSDASWPYQRPKTAAASASPWIISDQDIWNLGWTAQTPDLSVVLQEVVDRVDWTIGNALALLVTNVGDLPNPNDHRRVLAFERAMPDLSYTPATLVVQFSPPPPEPSDLLVSVGAPGAAAPGDRLTYLLTLRNQGPGPAKSVALNFELPEQVSFVRQNYSIPPEITGNTLVWSIDQIEPGQLISIRVDVDIDPEAPIGMVLTARSTASTSSDPDPGNNQDSAETTLKSAYAFESTLTPTTQQLRLGSEVLYRIKVLNLGLRPDSYTFNVAGINQDWITVSPSPLRLGGGGSGEAVIVIRVSPPPCQNEEIKQFSVEVVSVDGDNSKTLQGQVSLLQAPALVLESPWDRSTLGSRTAILRWRTVPATTSTVTVSGPEGTQKFTSDLASSHTLEVPGLVRNENYQWTVEAQSYCGTTSASRSFSIGNGIVFSQRRYSYELYRDYDQRFLVTVRNQDTLSHTLHASVTNPYSDILVNFIGSGSIDETITLAPGESRDLILVVHAQDAAQRYYELTARLVADEGTGIPIEDSAVINLDILAAGDFAIVEDESAFDPLTLGRSYVVTNKGRTITDLTLRVVDPQTGLPARIMLQPAVQHARLATGASLRVVAYPIFGPEDMNEFASVSYPQHMRIRSPYVPIDYQIEGSGGGNVVTEEGSAFCPAGNQIYAVKVEDAVWTTYTKGWYCTNRPIIEMMVEALANFARNTLSNIQMTLNFTPKGEEVQPHDATIFFNGVEIGGFEDDIPDGELTFTVPLDAWNEGQAGMVSQQILMETLHENLGHYVVTADPTISILIDEATFYVCASSQEEAEQLINEILNIKPLPEEVTIEITRPTAGAGVQLDDQGNVEIVAIVETDLGSVYDYFDVKGVVEYIDVPTVDPDEITFDRDGGSEDPIFEALWKPKAGGSVQVTVQASILGEVKATDTLTFSVQALPDFAVSNLYQDPNTFQYRYLTVQAEIENLGTAVEGPIDVEFRYFDIDPDTGQPTGDPLWVSSKVIFDGEVFHSGERITVSDGKQVGSEVEIYFVEVVVDP